MRVDVLIKNGQLVLFDRVITGNLQIVNGIIWGIGADLEKVTGDVEIDATGKHILPGFIDIHTHGAAGFDLTNGWFEPEQNRFVKDAAYFNRGMTTALQQYLQHGVTRIVCATVSAPTDEIIRALEYYDQFIQQNTVPTVAMLAGILIEGTFVQNPAYAGAMNPQFFRPPSIGLYQQMARAAGERIRSVNVTPEFGENAWALMDYLTARGVVVGAGHTGATADEIQKAIDHGLRIAIHFLNGPTGSSTKPFGHGGVIQAVLRSKELFAELITDGYHVDPAYVREVIARKGITRVIAISDSMFVTGLENIETFIVSGILGRLSANQRYLEVVGRQNALFGSVLTMDLAFANIISWLTQEFEGIWTEHFPALPFQEALIQATWMCSRNPAKALHLMRPEVLHFHQDLSAYTGSLDIGKSADVIVADITGAPGQYTLKVENVLLKGKVQPI